METQFLYCRISDIKNHITNIQSISSMFPIFHSNLNYIQANPAIKQAPLFVYILQYILYWAMLPDEL